MITIYLIFTMLLLELISDHNYLFAELHKYSTRTSEKYEKQAHRFALAALLAGIGTLIAAGAETVHLIYQLTH